MIVAAGPDDPGVAALDFGDVERNPAVHVAEVVFVGRLKRFRHSMGLHGLVEHRPRLRLIGAAAGESYSDNGRRDGQR